MQLPLRAARLAAFSLLGLLPAAVSAQMAYPYGTGSPYPAQQPYPASPYGYGPSTQPYGQPSYSQPPYNQPGYGYGAQPGYPQQTQPSYPQQAYDQPQYGYAAPQPYSSQAYPGQQAQQSLNAAQLEQLVAPVALYPDTLIAQMLAASTYPQQVVQADQWLMAQGNASPYQIAGGADVQPWDPSVKSLTAFPQVLAEMDRNQGWMAALGNAYYNQPQDVMQAIQVMRQRAQAAGTLQSTPQETMTYDQGNIQLAPPTPDMVYVPQYDPWTAYGDPVTPYPGFSLLGAIGSFFSTVGSGFLHFGPGIAMTAFNHTPFGWIGWALSWLTDAISFGHSTWATHSTAVVDWGLPYGGPRAYLGARVGYHGSAFGARGVATGGPVLGHGYSRASNQYAANRYESAPRFYQPSARTDYQRTPEAYNRASIARPENSFNNRAPAYSYNSRPQMPDRSEGRLAYGPDVYNSSHNFAAPMQPQRGYSSPSYRAPESGIGSYARPESSFRSGESYAYSQRSFKEPKSSGFHPFGGGSSYREPKQPKMEYKAPKMPKAPKMSSPKGSSHSSGGGHHRW